MKRLESNYPEGLEFLEKINESIFNACIHKTFSFIQNNPLLSSQVEGIGTLLSCLSRLSECYWGCHNGNEHTKEYLLGKACNSISAGWILLKNGHYDSCFSVIRETAEITNLFALFALVPKKFDDWMSSDEQTIRTKFSPASVRKALKKEGSSVPINEKIYGNLSKRFNHISPSTRPELHSNMDRPVASGTFQESGIEKTVCYMAYFIGKVPLSVEIEQRLTPL